MCLYLLLLSMILFLYHVAPLSEGNEDILGHSTSIISLVRMSVSCRLAFQFHWKIVL